MGDVRSRRRWRDRTCSDTLAVKMSTVMWSVLGFTLGVVATVFSLVQVYKKAGAKKHWNPRLFLNVTVNNMSEVVKKAMDDKAKEAAVKKPKTRFGFSSLGGNLTGGMMSTMAAAAVTSNAGAQSQVSDKISSELDERLPLRLAEKGIRATARTVYTRGNFFVVEVDLQHAELKKLIVETGACTEAHAQTATSFFKHFEDMCGGTVTSAIDSKVLGKCVEKLETMLPELVKERMEESGVKITCQALPEADQLDLMMKMLEHQSDKK